MGGESSIDWRNCVDLQECWTIQVQTASSPCRPEWLCATDDTSTMGKSSPAGCFDIGLSHDASGNHRRTRLDTSELVPPRFGLTRDENIISAILIFVHHINLVHRIGDSEPRIHKQ